MSRSSTKVPAEVYYPESDGKPRGETGIHAQANIEIYCTLRYQLYPIRPRLYVVTDMFFYDEQGNPRAVKAPDIMVIDGIKNRDQERWTFKLWVENEVPRLVIEVTSEETQRDDTIVKRELYARLGVREYFLFDPLTEYLDPQLQGFRLVGQRYEPIEPEPNSIFESHELGLKIQANGYHLRFYDAATNRPIPTTVERDQQSDNAVELLDALRTRQNQLEREQKKRSDKRKRPRPNDSKPKPNVERPRLNARKTPFSKPRSHA